MVFLKLCTGTLLARELVCLSIGTLISVGVPVHSTNNGISKLCTGTLLAGELVCLSIGTLISEGVPVHFVYNCVSKMCCGTRSVRK